MSKHEDILAKITIEGNDTPEESTHTPDFIPGCSSNDDGTPSVTAVLNGMVASIDRINLITTLIDGLGDDLLKYQDKHGVANQLKIPDGLFQVAIAHEVKGIASRDKWKMARSEADVIYLFNGYHWARVSDNLMESFAGSIAIKIGYYSPAKAKTVNFKKSLLKQLQSDAVIMPEPDRRNPVTLINVLNGTLAISEAGIDFKKHDAEDFQLYVLPFKYDKEAKYPVFDKYLQRVLPDESSQMVLQEFAGYVFTKHLKLEKALLLYGSGSNGKSVWFEVFTALLGDHNVSTKSLGDLTDSDGGNDARAKLHDKLLNYGAEIRAKDVDVDILKRLVSGEPVAAREKYKTGIDIRNNCKFVFNANVLPKGMERTHAYYRRFSIVPFTQTITDAEKDVTLHTKIIDNELAGVLNWVIDGLNRLLKQKKFTESEAINAEMKKYKLENNPVLLFIMEVGLVPSISSMETIDNLYSQYKEWCYDSGHRSLAKNNFSKEMIENGFEKGRNKTSRFFYCDRDDTDDPGEKTFFKRVKAEQHTKK